MLFIEFARRQRGMRQTELARVANVRQQFISQIERGEGIPPKDQRERLALALGVDPALLLKPVDLEGARVEDKPVVAGTETATA